MNPGRTGGRSQGMGYLNLRFGGGKVLVISGSRV